MLNKINTLSVVFSIVLASLGLLGTSNAYANDSLATHTTSETEILNEANIAGHEAHNNEHKEHGEEKFNAGKMILEHVGDAHDWHIAGHLSIPLPVIIYSKAGLDIFSSSRFEHGHAAYRSEKTNINYKLEENKVVAVNEDGSVNEEVTATFYDLSITKNVATLLFSVILLCWIFLSVAKAYTRNPGKAPKGLQSFVEPIIIFIRDDVAKASIGEKKYKKFMPYLLTVFFFIWINNLLGLIPIFPGGANLTGNVAVTLTLATLTFIITVVSANRHYWHHIFAMPGVPAWVLIILTPIEILGLFLRPFVLMVRLFANITAGHIIALSFFSLIFIFGEMNTGAGLGFSLFSTAFTVFMMVMELLVAFLQAYVFTLLSAVYFGTAVEEGHHEEAHAH
jgi:F-type H+-transporting ATPase subunit a